MKQNKQLNVLSLEWKASSEPNRTVFGFQEIVAFDLVSSCNVLLFKNY